MFLKIFSHKTLVGEIHFVGNLLDAHRAVLQHDAQFTCDVRVNPFAGCTPADGTYRFREVFRCNAQVLGVPSDTPFCSVVLLYGLYEGAEDDLCTGLVLISYLLEPVDDIAHVDNQCLQHCHDQFPAESVTGVYDFLTDVQDVAFQGLCLVSVEMEDGMCTGEEEEGGEFVDAADDVLKEVVRQDDCYSFAVVRQSVVADDLSFADDDDISLAYFMLLGVDRVPGLSAGAECKEKRFHAG